MPTGYTDIITKGATLEQYVWRCTRAFGATIMQRDDRLGARVQMKREPSTYYADALKRSEARLAELLTTTVEQAAALCDAEHRAELASHEKREAERKAENAAYAAMRAKVEALDLPASHASFKAFMLEQISISVFDHEPSPPERVSAERWLFESIQAERDNVGRYARVHEEELARCRESDEWLAAVAEAVPQPERMEP